MHFASLFGTNVLHGQVERVLPDEGPLIKRTGKEQVFDPTLPSAVNRNFMDVLPNGRSAALMSIRIGLVRVGASTNKGPEGPLSFLKSWDHFRMDRLME